MRMILLKRTRLIKLTVLVLLLLVAIPFFLSKPKGAAEYGAQPSTGGPKPVFKRDVLGNFEPKSLERVDGPGEGGAAHHVSSFKQNDVNQGMMEFGINVVASDDISLDRNIPDLRPKECKYWHYVDDLPRTSVIIVFHNEGWSPLLRTVHSVLNRSPPQFLEEVLLVDDYSDKDHLKAPLDDYIQRFSGKVRLVRNEKREGLIRTRSKGASEARGEVILFLDAHCEVGYNWLPPLLAPIKHNRTIMTVPVIDGIDKDTLEYNPVYGEGTRFRGIFEWGMLYKEIELPVKEAKKLEYKTEPYPSPTHAGGLFAVNRDYFLSIGAYDPGLLVWGGENFELSFKIWQCGGGIVWVPCSRVGHIYRAFMPYKFGDLAKERKGSLIHLNYKRVIEVWFDNEFKEYFYTREPMVRFLDAGDLTEQLEMKKRLKCHNFNWFMENVAYDVYTKFPRLPPNLYWGELRNEGSDLCLDSMGQSPPHAAGSSRCHGHGNNQLFRLNGEGQLGVGERCIEADNNGLKLVFCKLGTVDGPWVFKPDSKFLYHKTYRKCATVDSSYHRVILATCDDNDINMRWRWKELRPT